jgi:hypothetical protein
MRTYILEDRFGASGPAAGGNIGKLSRGNALDKKTKELERSFKKAHKIIERAQKKGSRSGKDKSLLRCACQLGYLVNDHPIMKDNKQYVNPMTFGDRLFLEEVGTYKSVEFFNNEFTDKNGNKVYIDGYK